MRLCRLAAIGIVVQRLAPPTFVRDARQQFQRAIAQFQPVSVVLFFLFQSLYPTIVSFRNILCGIANLIKYFPIMGALLKRKLWCAFFKHASSTQFKGSILS